MGIRRAYPQPSAAAGEVGAGYCGENFVLEWDAFEPGETVLLFSIKSDGTWSADNSVYNMAEGNWYNPTTAGIGAGYEVRFTPVVYLGNDTGVTNPAKNYVSLSASRTLQIAGKLRKEKAFNVKVEIRYAGGAMLSSCSFNFEVFVDV